MFLFHQGMSEKFRPIRKIITEYILKIKVRLIYCILCDRVISTSETDSPKRTLILSSFFSLVVFIKHYNCIDRN